MRKKGTAVLISKTESINRIDQGDFSHLATHWILPEIELEIFFY